MPPTRPPVPDDPFAPAWKPARDPAETAALAQRRDGGATAHPRGYAAVRDLVSRHFARLIALVEEADAVRARAGLAAPDHAGRFPDLPRTLADFGRDLEELHLLYLHRPLQVALMGIFNAGKSTLINRFFDLERARARRGRGEPPRRTSPAPVDDCITVLRRPPPGEARESVVVARRLDDPSGEPRVFVEERYFDDPFLVDLNLIDTPGLNETEAKDAIARRYLSQCDVILYLFLPVNAYNKEDSEVLRAARTLFADVELIPVINFVDILVDRERFPRLDDRDPRLNEEVDRVLAPVCRSIEAKLREHGFDFADEERDPDGLFWCVSARYDYQVAALLNFLRRRYAEAHAFPLRVRRLVNNVETLHHGLRALLDELRRVDLEARVRALEEYRESLDAPLAEAVERVDHHLEAACSRLVREILEVGERGTTLAFFGETEPDPLLTVDLNRPLLLAARRREMTLAEVFKAMRGAGEGAALAGATRSLAAEIASGAALTGARVAAAARFIRDARARLAAWLTPGAAGGWWALFESALEAHDAARRDAAAARREKLARLREEYPALVRDLFAARTEPLVGEVRRAGGHIFRKVLETVAAGGDKFMLRLSHLGADYRERLYQELLEPVAHGEDREEVKQALTTALESALDSDVNAPPRPTRDSAGRPLDALGDRFEAVAKSRASLLRLAEGVNAVVARAADDLNDEAAALLQRAREQCRARAAARIARELAAPRSTPASAPPPDDADTGAAASAGAADADAYLRLRRLAPLAWLLAVAVWAGFAFGAQAFFGARQPGAVLAGIAAGGAGFLAVLSLWRRRLAALRSRLRDAVGGMLADFARQADAAQDAVEAEARLAVANLNADLRARAEALSRDDLRPRLSNFLREYADSVYSVFRHARELVVSVAEVEADLALRRRYQHVAQYERRLIDDHNALTRLQASLEEGGALDDDRRAIRDLAAGFLESRA
ncbi:MAG: 50S ribosome-binding GTPase [Planctomycetes bacterium]|nr:50S ribosome-binding GTPase [Planctomycetota bacterium]